MKYLMKVIAVFVLFGSFSFQAKIDSEISSKRIKQNLGNYQLESHDKRFVDSDKDLQRKRSHKRRRKIKKPKKGIR